MDGVDARSAEAKKLSARALLELAGVHLGASHAEGRAAHTCTAGRAAFGLEISVTFRRWKRWLLLATTATTTECTTALYVLSEKVAPRLRLAGAPHDAGCKQ